MKRERRRLNSHSGFAFDDFLKLRRALLPEVSHDGHPVQDVRVVGDHPTQLERDALAIPPKPMEA
jgi:hypothetical protein